MRMRESRSRGVIVLLIKVFRHRVSPRRSRPAPAAADQRTSTTGRRRREPLATLGKAPQAGLRVRKRRRGLSAAFIVNRWAGGVCNRRQNIAGPTVFEVGDRRSQPETSAPQRHLARRPNAAAYGSLAAPPRTTATPRCGAPGRSLWRLGAAGSLATPVPPERDAGLRSATWPGSCARCCRAPFQDYAAGVSCQAAGPSTMAARPYRLQWGDRGGPLHLATAAASVARSPVATVCRRSRSMR